MRDTFGLNTLDPLRLGAALQLALHHANFDLEVSAGWWGFIARAIPGVPVFFSVSGLLISRSYESNSRLGESFRNRALLINPALIVCTAFALLVRIACATWMAHAYAQWSHEPPRLCRRRTCHIECTLLRADGFLGFSPLRK